MELITTPFVMEDIIKLKEAGADAVVIANRFFSARAAAYFELEELVQIRSVTKAHGMGMYVLMNRFFMEAELPQLRSHLAYVKELDVDGIYYGDEGVLFEAKKLHMEEKLIYNPDTLITNKEDVQYYLQEGISMVTLAREITLQEICEIAQQVKDKCEVVIHGRVNMMHSRRRCLSNYCDFLGKKEDVKDNYNLYIMEETREDAMPILEDDLGTHVFSGYTLASFREVQELERAGIQHMRIDGIFHDIAYVCDVVSRYRDVLAGRVEGSTAFEEFTKTYPLDHAGQGFYYTKTSKNKQVTL